MKFKSTPNYFDCKPAWLLGLRLITGGAGFIGANFVLDWLALNDEPVINLDKLTYAGNPETLQSLQGDAPHPGARRHR
jgi:nucleoside-diphosphate-sugar epimerase